MPPPVNRVAIGIRVTVFPVVRGARWSTGGALAPGGSRRRVPLRSAAGRMEGGSVGRALFGRGLSSVVRNQKAVGVPASACVRAAHAPSTGDAGAEAVDAIIFRGHISKERLLALAIGHCVLKTVGHVPTRAVISTTIGEESPTTTRSCASEPTSRECSESVHSIMWPK